MTEFKREWTWAYDAPLLGIFYKLPSSPTKKHFFTSIIWFSSIGQQEKLLLGLSECSSTRFVKSTIKQVGRPSWPQVQYSEGRPSPHLLALEWPTKTSGDSWKVEIVGNVGTTERCNTPSLQSCKTYGLRWCIKAGLSPYQCASPCPLTLLNSKFWDSRAVIAPVFSAPCLLALFFVRYGSYENSFVCFCLPASRHAPPLPWGLAAKPRDVR